MAGERLEALGRERSAAHTSQLALHFEAAGETSKAAFYLREAAKVAMRRDAPRDAMAMLERSIELVDADPSMPDRDKARVLALSYLSHAHQLVYGFVAPSVEKLWDRTRDLAAAGDDAREQAVAEAGRIMVACVSAAYAQGEETIRGALPLLEAIDDGARQALLFCSATVRWRIAALADASRMFESALALEGAANPLPGADIMAVVMSQYAPVTAITGRIAETRRLVAESMVRASDHSHYSECVSAALAAFALVLLQDFEAAAPIAERALELARDHDYPTWSTRPLCLLGICDMHAGRVDQGIERMQQGLTGREADNHLVDGSAIYCLYAEALMDAGRDGAEEYLDLADDFIARTGELFYESEVYRLRARAARIAGACAADVLPDLRSAHELSVLRGVHWHTLLAAVDLARCLGETGSPAEARALLEPALAAIPDAAELPALKNAAALLNTLAQG
jgi:tetratricopeptide (TPR) repeat protein